MPSTVEVDDFSQSSNTSLLRVKEEQVSPLRTTSPFEIITAGEPVVQVTEHRQEEAVNNAPSSLITVQSPGRLVVKKLPFEVIDVKSSKTLSLRERLLSKFFRCFEFPKQCAFHSNDQEKFTSHMAEQHCGQRFKCHYCGPVRTETYSEAGLLLQHIISCHSHRRFQCNLCLYRASHVLQLHLHFIDCHIDNYNELSDIVRSATSAITTMTSGADIPSTLTRDLASVTISKNLALPKVLLCPPVVNVFPLNHDGQVLSQFRTERINKIDYKISSDSEKGMYKDFYQCIYCRQVNKYREDILLHLAKTHPDFPVMYYLPGAQERKKSMVVKTEAVEPTPETTPKRQPLFSAPINEPEEAPEETIPDLGDLPRTRPSLTRTVIEEEESNQSNASPSNFWNNHSDDGDVNDRAREIISNQDLALSDEEEEVKSGIAPSTPSKTKRLSTSNRQTKRTRHLSGVSTDATSDDDEVYSVGKKRGVQLEKERLIQGIQVVPTPNANPYMKHKKCMMSNCRQLVLESKISLHMTSMHSSEYATKCKDCDFLGSKKDIKDHIKTKHAGKGAVVSIMVPPEDTEPLFMEVVDFNSSGGRRSIAMSEAVPGSSSKRSLPSSFDNFTNTLIKRRHKNEPPARGHLMKELKESTFLGPTKNQRTERTRSDSGGENREQ